MAEIRVELRAKNSALWHCVFDHFTSIRKFAQFYNLPYQEVSLYLKLTRSPYTKNGEPRTAARKVATAMSLTMDTLFPKSVYLDHIVPAFAVEVDVERFVALRHATTSSHLLAGPPSDELFDLRDALRKQLDTLTPREQQTIDALFGLSDGEPKTLEQVGGMLDLSRERIRQIQAGALRKLRHQDRAKVITPFLTATGKHKPRKRYRVIHPRHDYFAHNERVLVCDQIPGLEIDPKSLKGCTVTVYGQGNVYVREVKVSPNGEFALTVGAAR